MRSLRPGVTTLRNPMRIRARFLSAPRIIPSIPSTASPHQIPLRMASPQRRNVIVGINLVSSHSAMGSSDSRCISTATVVCGLTASRDSRAMILSRSRCGFVRANATRVRPSCMRLVSTHSMLMPRDSNCCSIKECCVGVRFISGPAAPRACRCAHR